MPPSRRRRWGKRHPANALGSNQAAPRNERSHGIDQLVGVRVWYRVRDLTAAREFYAQKLGFAETYFDRDASWAKLEHGETEIALAEGEPEEGGVAAVDVEDVKAEAERLREDGVKVGVVLEIHGELRIVDVFDPDGNRIQFTQDIATSDAASDGS